MTFRASVLATAVAAFVTLVVIAVSGPTLEGQETRGKAALMNPEALNEQAPATFKAQFDTSKGTFVVKVQRAWAPFGADRVYSLVKRGFYDGNRFFRFTEQMAVFGIPGDPEIAKIWLGQRIPDDETRKQGNKEGTLALTHAKAS